MGTYLSTCLLHVGHILAKWQTPDQWLHCSSMLICSQIFRRDVPSTLSSMQKVFSRAAANSVRQLKIWSLKLLHPNSNFGTSIPEVWDFFNAKDNQKQLPPYFSLILFLGFGWFLKNEFDPPCWFSNYSKYLTIKVPVLLKMSLKSGSNLIEQHLNNMTKDSKTWPWKRC